VPLYGVFYENTNAVPIMVLHYAEKGSLRDLIDVEVIRDIEFAWIVRLATCSSQTNLFTQAVAHALTYLHSRILPIFHGDLHTVRKNIMQKMIFELKLHKGQCSD
jgi:serine/threonine protein kinase